MNMERHLQEQTKASGSSKMLDTALRSIQYSEIKLIPFECCLNNDGYISAFLPDTWGLTLTKYSRSCPPLRLATFQLPPKLFAHSIATQK